jgi:Domain of unknown function (DUF3846)
MMKVMILEVYGGTKLEHCKKKDNYEYLTAAVGGRIELFPLKYRGARVWVNEEGVYTCPLNNGASLLFNQQVFGNVVIEGWELEDGTFEK